MYFINVILVAQNISHFFERRIFTTAFIVVFYTFNKCHKFFTRNLLLAVKFYVLIQQQAIKLLGEGWIHITFQGCLKILKKYRLLNVSMSFHGAKGCILISTKIFIEFVGVIIHLFICNKQTAFNIREF